MLILIRKLAAILMIVSGIVFDSAVLACGTERWAVKVGKDADASSVNLSHPVATTIAELDKKPYPSKRPSNNRVTDVEKTVYVVDAFIVYYAHESNDDDFHLALSDGKGHKMIAEIPDPSCLSSSDPFLPGVTKSRQAVIDNLHITSTFQKGHIPVRITGVGFFDKKHGQKGMAKDNAIELHPVLDIQFK